MFNYTHRLCLLSKEHLSLLWLGSVLLPHLTTSPDRKITAIQTCHTMVGNSTPCWTEHVTIPGSPLPCHPKQLPRSCRFRRRPESASFFPTFYFFSFTVFSTTSTRKGGGQRRRRVFFPPAVIAALTRAAASGRSGLFSFPSPGCRACCKFNSHHLIPDSVQRFP